MIDNIGMLVSCFLLSFFLATWLIRWGIPKLRQESRTDKGLPGGQDKTIFDFRSTGFWIGFFETLLVFVFVYEASMARWPSSSGPRSLCARSRFRKIPPTIFSERWPMYPSRWSLR